MIPSTVKVGALRLGSAFHPDFRKNGVPSVGGLTAHGIEIKSGDVVGKVLTGIVGTHDGKTNLHDDFGFIAEVQHSLHVLTFQLSFCRYLLIVLHETHLPNGFGELRHKIDILVIHPSQGVAHTGNLVFTGLLQGGRIDFLPVSDGVCQIDDDRSFLATSERITMHTGIGGGGQFRFHLLVRQFHGVITGTCLFVGMRESCRKVDVTALPYPNGGSGGTKQ